jgi:hypothetical protein
VVSDREVPGSTRTSWQVTADWLSHRFGLEPHPGWQDYPLEVCDPARVQEFVQAYELEPLNPAQRLMLMELILYSLDEFDLDGLDLNGLGINEPASALPDKSSAGILQRIRSLLELDWPIHAQLVRYWALIDHPDSIDGFSITPFAQNIWTKQGQLLRKDKSDSSSNS